MDSETRRRLEKLIEEDPEGIEMVRRAALRALFRRQMRQEAIASVNLDRDSDVHTCYPGHDCRSEKS